MKHSQVHAAFARAMRAAVNKDDWGRAVARGELKFMGLICNMVLLIDVIVIHVGGRRQVKGSCSLNVFNCGGQLDINARGSIHFVVSDTAVGDGMHYFKVALADVRTQLTASAEFLAVAERAQLVASHPRSSSAPSRRQGRL